MKEVLRTRDNLIKHGKDEITHLILKLERESANNLMIAFMHIIIEPEYCPEDWKGTRAILLFKGETRTKPENEVQ
jgi:hypothetical protein